jgi:hypothetical protein
VFNADGHGSERRFEECAGRQIPHGEFASNSEISTEFAQIQSYRNYSI